MENTQENQIHKLKELFNSINETYKQIHNSICLNELYVPNINMDLFYAFTSDRLISIETLKILNFFKSSDYESLNGTNELFNTNEKRSSKLSELEDAFSIFNDIFKAILTPTNYPRIEFTSSATYSEICSELSSFLNARNFLRTDSNQKIINHNPETGIIIVPHLTDCSEFSYSFVVKDLSCSAQYFIVPIFKISPSSPKSSDFIASITETFSNITNNYSCSKIISSFKLKH